MPSGKRARARSLLSAARAQAAPAEIRSRRTSAEQAYSGILGRLGARGTYDLPVAGQRAAQADPETAGPAGRPSGAAETPETGAVFRKTNFQEGVNIGAIDIDTRYHSPEDIGQITELDPEATVRNVEKSAQFRIASRLTAEAEQLIAREGPLYNEMLNNMQLPIIEGSAAVARENAAQLKRAMARGGAARREAMQAVQQIRSRERVNSQKVQQLAQTRFALDQWARQNARTTLQFGQNWAANLGGIRESYNQAMDLATDLMVSKALPLVIGEQARAAALRQKAHAENRAKVGRWISGALSAATLAIGGLGAASAVGILGGAGKAGLNTLKAGGAGSGAGLFGRVGQAAAPYTGELIGAGTQLLGASLPSAGGQQSR